MIAIPEHQNYHVIARVNISYANPNITIQCRNPADNNLSLTRVLYVNLNDSDNNPYKLMTSSSLVSSVTTGTVLIAFSNWYRLIRSNTSGQIVIQVGGTTSTFYCWVLLRNQVSQFRYTPVDPIPHGMSFIPPLDSPGV